MAKRVYEEPLTLSDWRWTIIFSGCTATEKCHAPINILTVMFMQVPSIILYGSQIKKKTIEWRTFRNKGFSEKGRGTERE